MNIVVISRDDCIWCKRAKGQLKVLGLDYREYNISHIAQVAAFFKDAGFKTVPQIFIDGVHVGGFDRLIPYLYESSIEEASS